MKYEYRHVEKAGLKRPAQNLTASDAELAEKIIVGGKLGLSSWLPGPAGLAAWLAWLPGCLAVWLPQLAAWLHLADCLSVAHLAPS